MSLVGFDRFYYMDNMSFRCDPCSHVHQPVKGGYHPNGFGSAASRGCFQRHVTAVILCFKRGWKKANTHH